MQKQSQVDPDRPLLPRKSIRDKTKPSRPARIARLVLRWSTLIIPILLAIDL